jgi:RNA polymerase sigma-70 factor (ECF subfamily)
MTESDSTLVVELLAKARQGDERCREILFERCRDYVALMARTKVESWMRRKVDASDLVQQTMLDAMQGMDRFEGTTEAEWLGWLRQVLTHNLHDFIRRYRTAKRAAGREQQLDLPADDSRGAFLGPELADSIATPSQVLIQHEHELALAAAIARLSPDHREVIELRNLQRLPFDEVAERMGRTRPAVQMLWTRAIKKLEELLRAEPDATR